MSPALRRFGSCVVLCGAAMACTNPSLDKSSDLTGAKSAETLTLPGFPPMVSDPTTKLVGWLDVRYTNDADFANVPAQFQNLDLIEPRTQLPFVGKPDGERGGAHGDGLPIVVFVHGGTWMAGDKRSYLAHAPSANPDDERNLLVNKIGRFADAGLCYCSVNYRLTQPQTPWRYPAHVEDVASAVAWLHQHAREFGGDPDRIVLIGHSAGAQLAALIATDERWLAAHQLSFKIIAGVVLLDGAGYDLLRRVEQQPIASERLDVIFSNDRDVWRDASPITHVAAGKGIPPFLLFVAGRREVSADESALFAAALTSAGVRADVSYADDKNHVSIQRDLGLPGDAVTTRVLEFAKEVTTAAAVKKEANQ